MHPSSKEWWHIAKELKIKWNFLYCLGAIDRKQVAIQPPPGGGSYYYNYKGFHRSPDHLKTGVGLPSITHTTGCQVMRALSIMKWQISWQEQDLNIRS
jgi:hypothetical protein